MEDLKSIERGGKICADDTVAFDSNIFGISLSPPVETRNHQQRGDQRMRRVPVFRMEKVDALAKNAQLVVSLYSKPLSRIDATQPALKSENRFAVRRRFEGWVQQTDSGIGDLSFPGNTVTPRNLFVRILRRRAGLLSRLIYSYSFQSTVGLFRATGAALDFA